MYVCFSAVELSVYKPTTLFMMLQQYFLSTTMYVFVHIAIQDPH